MASFTKACIDLSNSLRNFRFSKNSPNNKPQALSEPPSRCSPTHNPTQRGTTVAAIKQRLFNQGLKIDLSPKRRKKTRYKEYMRQHLPETCLTVHELMRSENFLQFFLPYFPGSEMGNLARVCKLWNTVIYDCKLWNSVQAMLNFKVISDDTDCEQYRSLFSTLISRQIDSLILFKMSDRHVDTFLNEMTAADLHLTTRLVLRCTALTDRSLERLTEAFSGLECLELHCCNDLSEAALWTCLSPAITELTLADNINISDESLGAVSQLLPRLRVLNLQAYHVTDMAMTYFSNPQRVSIETLRLTQCMDVTNQGIVNLAHALSGLRVLSLSGCSKLSDDGLDVVCENMKNLRFLDLSWCPKITDSGLECVACDLTELEELILDRCPGVTDTGLRYLSTMTNIRRLHLRWSIGLTDAGLIHILSMTSLRYLSLAGCKRISEDGLCALVRHGRFLQLEITNCRAATPLAQAYLRQNMSSCLLLT